MNKPDFLVLNDFKHWWDANHTKLSYRASMLKGAAVWNAAVARTKILEEALESIASYTDVGACERLIELGSYSGFDEPSSVKAARQALKAYKEKYMYTVVVSNIGQTLATEDYNEASKEYNAWVEVSKTGKGRGGFEDVTLMYDGEVLLEYDGDPEGAKDE